MRGSTQLRVWELQEMDDEAKAHVHQVRFPMQTPHDTPLVTPKSTTFLLNESKASIAPSIRESLGKMDVAHIAPFNCVPPTPITPALQPHHGEEIPLRVLLSNNKENTRKLYFKRPPVFGPEAVVLDPHIKAVHRQLMYEVCRWGVCSLIVSLF